MGMRLYPNQECQCAGEEKYHNNSFIEELVVNRYFSNMSVILSSKNWWLTGTSIT